MMKITVTAALFSRHSSRRLRSAFIYDYDTITVLILKRLRVLSVQHIHWQAAQQKRKNMTGW